MNLTKQLNKLLVLDVENGNLKRNGNELPRLVSVACSWAQKRRLGELPST